MTIGNAHKMARRVRKYIENDEAVFTAIKDKVIDVLLFAYNSAENAADGAISLADVFETPWGPEAIH